MKVNTEALTQQTLTLRSAATRLCDIQDTVRQITGRLGRETVGEKFVPSLSRAGMDILARSGELRQMSVALEQIAQLLTQCEQNIADEAEGARHHFVRHLPVPCRILRLPDRAQPLTQLDPGILDWTPWDP